MAQIVTYSATHGDARLPYTKSLCGRHDTRRNRNGYAQVSHGLHRGECDLCTPREQERTKIIEHNERLIRTVSMTCDRCTEDDWNLIGDDLAQCGTCGDISAAIGSVLWAIHRNLRAVR
jgi:hypothetical protein